MYFNQSRISSHKRIYNKVNQYSTLNNHMPDHHRRYAEHTSENVKIWAERTGKNTLELVLKILDQQVEKRALKILSGIQNLEKKYNAKLIEETSEIIMSITTQPTLATFKTIIKRQGDFKKKDSLSKTTIATKTNQDYGFSRGADYWRIK